MSTKTIQNGNENFGIQYYYVEIINKNANKWEATRHLANELQIDSKEMVSFGDNINDIEIIKNSGLGIAMENASDLVKSVANEITLKNDENGVAEGIYRILRWIEKSKKWAYITWILHLYDICNICCLYKKIVV